MRVRTCFLVLFGSFDLVGAHDNAFNHFEKSMRHAMERPRVDQTDGRLLLPNMMVPGDRVSAIDRTSAKCSANPDPGRESSIKRTVINYYYAIESTEMVTTNDSAGRSMIRMLEDKLFRTIRPAILWCYFDALPSTRRNLRSYHTSFMQDQDSGKQNILRKLSFEDARHLSIVSFSTSPEDKETPINCNFRRQGDTHCVVMHGRVTIIHHETSDVSLAVASIFDSTQKAMDYSEIFFDLQNDKNLDTITNIEWLGETEQDAINGGPNGNGMIIGEPSGVIEAVTEQDENESVLAYALSVPILVLIAFALLLTKNKEKRKVKTKSEIIKARNFDDVLIGTGDDTNSFHEGMYHYTKNGERYLSTNCPDCIETKKMGFYTAGNLDTITEHSVEEDCDQSAHRKKFFVSPSTDALGVKHSSIDVHNCRSARCPICAYNPRDVEFISKSDDFITLRSGESEV